MSQKILIAKVNSAHGIKGEVKVTIFCDEVKNIEKYELFDHHNQPVNLQIISNKKSIKHNNRGDAIVIARINNINNRNQAELLRNFEVFTLRSNFLSPKKNEFYIVDLIGLKVVNHNHQQLGVIENVSNLNSQAILEIKFSVNINNFKLGETESFIFKNDFFPEVNIDEGYILFEIPEFI